MNPTLIAALIGPFVELVRGSVTDVADPRLREFVRGIVVDAAALARLSATSAFDPAEVDRLRKGIEARRHALASIPELVAAEKRDEFLGLTGNAVDLVVRAGLTALDNSAATLQARVLAMADHVLPPIPGAAP
jgi:hypothetical protein